MLNSINPLLAPWLTRDSPQTCCCYRNIPDKSTPKLTTVSENATVHLVGGTMQNTRYMHALHRVGIRALLQSGHILAIPRNAFLFAEQGQLVG